MFPANFDYYRAGSLAEAVTLLQRHPGAKILAGGHSLVPAMKLRVSNPPALVDIGRIADLKSITVANGQLTVGALCTHAEIANSQAVKDNCGVLAQAAGQIGDQMIRTRGTIGGSLAHADPAADYPTVVRALGGVITVFGPSGMRTINADSFFVDLFTTALTDSEIITSITVAANGAGTSGHYYKIPHPASGYAVVGACAIVTKTGGVCSDVSVTVGGATANPIRCTGVESTLNGQAASEANISAAAAKVDESVNATMGDQYASTEYRAHLAAIAVKRALMAATA